MNSTPSSSYKAFTSINHARDLLTLIGMNHYHHLVVTRFISNDFAALQFFSPLVKATRWSRGAGNPILANKIGIFNLSSHNFFLQTLDPTIPQAHLDIQSGSLLILTYVIL